MQGRPIPGAGPWWLLVLVILSLGYFAARGPGRAVVRSIDFPMYYSASRACVDGLESL